MPHIKLKQIISEVLNELEYDRFKGMTGACVPPEQFVEILNTELQRLLSKKRGKPKRPVNDPMFTRNMILRGMGVTPPKRKTDPMPDLTGKEIDIKNIIKQLIQYPDTIFDKGEKSKHSDTEDSETINTGIPAFKGILWDSKKQTFFLLNTCPGAGTCVKPCYALDGYYRFNDGKVTKLAQRLQLLVDKPDEYEEMAYMEAARAAGAANASEKTLYIRWNDAGDFFDDEYLNIAIRVTEKLKKRYKVQSYAYTKVAAFFNKGEENGFVMNFSSGAATNQKNQLKDKLRGIKLSEIVPYDLHKPFWILKRGNIAHKPGEKPYFKNEDAKIGLKKAVYEKYKDHPEAGGFSFESLKYTDELPRQQGEKNQYNVIVLPYGDSDAGSQRRDVRVSFLCEH